MSILLLITLLRPLVGAGGAEGDGILKRYPGGGADSSLMFALILLDALVPVLVLADPVESLTGRAATSAFMRRSKFRF